MPATASDSRMIRLVSCTSAMSTSPGRLLTGNRHSAAQVGGWRLGEVSLRRQAMEEIDMAAHIMIEDRKIAAGHVGHGDLVGVGGQLVKNSTHRDDIVVRVRREADHPLAPRQLGAAPILAPSALNTSPLSAPGEP